jgi:WD40 repeat protein
MAYKLLAALPRSRLAAIQRKIAPLLQFDVVGVSGTPFSFFKHELTCLHKSLPAEVSIQIFSHLPFQTLLTCALVSRRWQALANDQTIWKRLCTARGWTWRQPARTHTFEPSYPPHNAEWNDSDDEGMGDSDDGGTDDEIISGAEADLALMPAELDSGFASMSSSDGVPLFSNARDTLYSGSAVGSSARSKSLTRHSAPSVLKTTGETLYLMPNYKLLHQTLIKLRNRFLSSNYRLSALQTRGAPSTAHTNTIYCLQLYTYPETGQQVLFTGSRDRSIREWNLTTGLVERIISGVHSSSVLSLCAQNGYLASAGSDRRVMVWHLESNELVGVICDHEDSVLCVRFDDERLVSCSKGMSFL